MRTEALGQAAAQPGEVVLEAYARSVPGFVLYYPSRAQNSPALRSFVDVMKEVLGASSKRAAR